MWEYRRECKEEEENRKKKNDDDDQTVTVGSNLHRSKRRLRLVLGLVEQVERRMFFYVYSSVLGGGGGVGLGINVAGVSGDWVFGRLFG